MKYNELEQKIKKYFQIQTDSFKLPEETEIKAFKEQNTQIQIVTKRRRIKPAAMIAACVAAAILMTAVLAVYDRLEGANGDFTSTVNIPNNMKQFGELKVVEGIADWYEPGSFEVKTTMLQYSTDATLGNSGALLRPVSAQTLNEDVFNFQLPEWCNGIHSYEGTTKMPIRADARYVRLRYNDRDAMLEDCGNSYPMYDLQENKIVSLTGIIFSQMATHLSAQCGVSADDHDIFIEEFDYSKWCIFRVKNQRELIFEWYFINLETGEFKQISQKRIAGFSNDMKSVVYYEAVLLKEYNWKAEYKYIYTLCNLETGEEKTILELSGKPYQDNCDFSEDNRYIMTYAPYVSGTIEQYIPQNQTMVFYDTETGNVGTVVGKLIRYTENNDAIIVEDTSGAKVYRLSDMADVTDSYELEVYERYAINAELNDGIFTLYAKSLFDDAKQVILIADNVHACREWGGYIYIYQGGSDKIMVYSTTNNEIFEYPCPYVDKYDADKYTFDIFIYDSGKQCRLVAYKRAFDTDGGEFR